MINIGFKEYLKIKKELQKEIKEKCGTDDDVLARTQYCLMFKNEDKISIGAYISRESRKFHFPACDDWQVEVNNVNTFRVCIHENDRILPIREDVNIMENKDFLDYYVLFLRVKDIDNKYYLELYHKNNIVFSVQTAYMWFQCGVDLKIIYVTKKKDIFTHWVYREGKHIELYESGEGWFSQTEYSQTHRRIPNIFNGDYVELFFHYVNCKRFYISEYFAKTNGDYFKILPRQFDDDDTCNYVVGFQKDRFEDILFMNYCIQTEIGGYAVYGFTINELENGCIRLKSEKSLYLELSLIWKSIDYELQCREVLKHIYKSMNVKENLFCVPKIQYLDKTLTQSTSVMRYVENHYKSLGREDYPQYKEKYNSIYDELVASGIVQVKWKSEYELYKMVKRNYPDAIYQYRAKWLGIQSLDIFIPSLRIGIEYQGIQHYKAVSLFGGEEGLFHRKQLDEIKRKLCLDNNVKLIYWRYDEKISRVLLKRKFGNI